MKRKSVTLAAMAAAIVISVPSFAAPTAGADINQLSSQVSSALNLPKLQELPQVEQPANVQEKTGYLTSTDGKGTQVFWRSQQIPNARGTVVLVHGALEHSGRYDDVANQLLQGGYNVYRMDHRGHGKTAEANPGTQGDIDDFHYLVDDINSVVQQAKAENPELKTFMMGHSLGAIASQFYGIKYPGQVDGFITNAGGVPFNKSGINDAADIITPRDITDAQRKYLPSLMEFLPLAQMTTFNEKLSGLLFPNNKELRLPSPSITNKLQIPIPNLEFAGQVLMGGFMSNPAVIRSMYNDPLVSKQMSVGLAMQLTLGTIYSAINADLFTAPTLIYHGANDGLNPPFQSQNWYNSIASQDKEIIFWKGQFHEVFKEPAKSEAVERAIEWMDARI